MESFVSGDTNWILSYPRSGNHFIRYLIEFMTKRITLGCRGGESVDTPIADRPGVKLLGHVSRNPIARKAHFVCEVNTRNADRIILGLRNPIDAMISHHVLTDNQPKKIEKEAKEFVKNLMMYEAFKGKKAIVKYEDLVSDNAYEKPVSLIADVFDVDEETLDRTLTDYRDLRRDSLGSPIQMPQSVDRTGKVRFSRSQLLKSMDPAGYEKIVDVLKEVLEHDIMKLYYGSLISGGLND